MNQEIINNMKKHCKDLSKYACNDVEAIRFSSEEEDIRTPFFRDIDRILYSLSYIRYIDKTQVYSNIENDMISRRIIHVQLVSKISRTIGRALNLNEDLIEAASLGHDLGHVPFGHEGEKILNNISLKYGEGYFKHNVQSVRVLMDIENHGIGSNITLQVLDAILCHNGEKLQKIYIPKNKTKEEFILEYDNCYKEKTDLINSMTLEGCVVRISDIIAYLGKDIEDAVRLKRIRIEDIPKSITDVLGNSNRNIINTIIMDVISNSMGNNYIKLSDTVFNAINELIRFNYKYIYANANTKQSLQKYEKIFNDLFDLYYTQIKNEETSTEIYLNYFSKMSEKYRESTSIARVVIDYISGMTDDYIQSQYNKNFINVK